MEWRKAGPALVGAAALALAACGGADGDGADNGNGNGQAALPSAEAAASAEANGATLPLRRPRGIERRLLPPGAVIGANPDEGSSDLVFGTREPPAELLDWFRGTGNGGAFILDSELEEGAEHVFSGRVRGTGEAYAVRIAPGPGGGTTGTIVVIAR